MKRDANEREIVKALRCIGATVVLIDSNVPGVPDLAVGWQGQWHMIEIKAPKGRLSEGQLAWHRDAAAPVHVVRTVEEALAAVRVIR